MGSRGRHEHPSLYVQLWLLWHILVRE
jgi:hypothetical protein